MSNTIDLKMSNNAMEALSFYWTAEFKDGSTIYQFKNGTENKFQLVQDRFADLKTFLLYHKEKPILFVVDLIDGLVSTEILPAKVYEFNTKKQNIRLIYRRTVRRYLSESLKETGSDIWYLLGVQYNDYNGNNCKVILQIDKNGQFIIGD
jgi:hypothetical protein